MHESAIWKTTIYSCIYCVGTHRPFQKKEHICICLHFSGHFFPEGPQLRFFIDLGSSLASILDKFGGKSRTKGVPETNRKTQNKKKLRKKSCRCSQESRVRGGRGAPYTLPPGGLAQGTSDTLWPLHCVPWGTVADIYIYIYICICLCVRYVCRLSIPHNGFHNSGRVAEVRPPSVVEASEGRLHYWWWRGGKHIKNIRKYI